MQNQQEIFKIVVDHVDVIFVIVNVFVISWYGENVFVSVLKTFYRDYKKYNLYNDNNEHAHYSICANILILFPFCGLFLFTINFTTDVFFYRNNRKQETTNACKK